MDYRTMLIFAFLIGIIGGFLIGMFGITGGSVRIPLLNLIGFSLINAFAINLFTIPLSSLMGLSMHKKNLVIKEGVPLAIGGVIGTAIGVFIALSLSLSHEPIILAIIFIIEGLITLVGLNLYKWAPSLAQRIQPSSLKIASGSIFLNILTGIRGGSGGSLYPAYLRLYKLDMHHAIATSLFATIFTSLTGVFIFWNAHDLDPLAGIIIFLGSIFGTRIGSAYSIKTKTRTLEIALSIIVVAISFIPLYEALA